MSDSADGVGDNELVKARPIDRGVSSLRSRLGNAARSNGPAIVFFVAIVVVWQLVVVGFRVSSFILPSPSDIIGVVASYFPDLMLNTWTTTYEIVVGFVVGNVAAVLIAILIAHSHIVERALYPLIIASQTIPKVAVAPLFLIWFGSGLTPKVIIAALVCFFPTVVNTVQGLKATDPNAIALFKLVAASRRDMFLKLEFPMALPYFFAGLKISVALAVIGAVIGEWVGASSGLGYVVLYSTQTERTDFMFAALVLLSILGIVMYLIVAFVERVLSWESSGVPVGGL